MKPIALCLTALLAVAAPLRAYAQVIAPPQIVNFQGKLASSSGNPVPDGTYSIRFSLWNALSAGTEKWSQTLSNVQVKNGAFAVPLSGFPATTFDGNLWLEIKIGTDAPLAPRTQIVSVPYALKSNLALTVPDGTLTASKFASGLFNSTAWLLGGNSGVTNGFLGTTDNQPLDLRANNQRVMRYELATISSNNTTYFVPNVIGGYSGNVVTAGVVGATIAGGGGFDFTPAATFNSVTDLGGTVGGGSDNRAGNNDDNTTNSVFATIGGGNKNRASNVETTVGGGYSNTASGVGATVAGGSYNTSSGLRTTVGGGEFNSAGGFLSTVAGGRLNLASSYGFVGGGLQNWANVEYTVVGGGRENTASSQDATIPGGYQNSALNVGSFAAGYRAKAIHDGAFVWSDVSGADFGSSANNQFSIRAAGGIVVESNANPVLHTSSTVGEKNRYLLLINSPQTQTASGLKAGGILCADDFAYADPGKSNLVVKGRVSVGGSFSDINYKMVVNGSIFAFGNYDGSDVRWKKNIMLLDNALDSVLSLRGVSYEWDKAKFPQQNFGDGKQMGFIAQEVEKIFPHLVLTAPDGYKAVNYIGVLPVLVEAVKSLKAQKDAEVTALKTENAELRARLQRIEAALNLGSAKQK